ncbi:MAG: hypothetical protein IJ025_01250 [Clostridia bacterium]|nr:hypothetical protein [Clostridia bacterium]
MKKIAIKISACLLALTLLTSCSNTNVLKTKELNDKITQTSVITKSNTFEQEEFSEFFINFKQDFVIPGLFEGIIPQGICYDETTGYILISGYYEDKAYPSMIMCIEQKSGKFVSAHPLTNIEGDPYYGHAGGIASSENTVYVTNNSECYTFPAKNLTNIKNGEKLQFNGKFKLNTLGSFACINNNILWVGDFIESDDKERQKVTDVTTLNTGETFYAYCEGYILEDGLPSVNKINSESTGYIPDYFLAIPEQVQGIAFTKTDKIIFSTSYGRRNNSKIYIYDDILIAEKTATKKIDGTDVDLFACNNENLIKEIVAPPMSEGMATHPDGIYMIFESGAAKYRNGNGKYPLETAFITTIE